MINVYLWPPPSRQVLAYQDHRRIALKPNLRGGATSCDTERLKASLVDATASGEKVGYFVPVA